MNENNTGSQNDPSKNEQNQNAYPYGNANVNQNRRKVEEEFRASQTYRAISNSSSNAADKIASGLGTAASAIESFMSSVDQVISNNVNQTQQRTGGNQNGTMPSGVHYSSQQGRPLTPPVPPVPPRVKTRAPKMPQPPKMPKPSVYANYVPPETNKNLKLVREPSVVKFYLTAIVAVMYAISAPLSSLDNFMGFILTTGMVFVLSSMIFRGKKRYVVDMAEAPKQEPVKTGNSEVDKTILEGNEYLRKLKKANEAIPDKALSDSIDRIEITSAGIFNFIAENPDSVPQIRKFMSYYLPTTMKLLDSYQRLSGQAVKGETITSTMQDIERMLYTVAGAFEKQLDSLFSEEAMDISTDISVFETMLRQEGYVKEEGAPGTLQ